MFKNVGRNLTKKGIPAAVGGLGATVIDSLIGKYATNDKGESMVPDWIKPLVPGLVGVAIMDGKNSTMDYAAAGAIGYSVGQAGKDKVSELIGDSDFVADDLDDLLDNSNEE